MDRLKTRQKSSLKFGDDPQQNGSAIVIALFILALISIFVALALSRTAIEAAAVGNETTEARTVYAAQGSLEMMTRNFNKVFEVKLNPSNTDINAVRNGTVPLLSAPVGTYSFVQEVDRTSQSTAVTLSGGPYSGLYAIRDNWRLRTTATDASQVQVQLTRNVLNNRIPIFQFGIFYDDDLELFRPPRFAFGGRIHSNRNFYVSPGTEGVYFDSRVTAVGEIITQTWRNGFTGDSANNQTFIKNASAMDVQLLPNKGSVLNTTSGDPNNIFASNPDFPPSQLNPTWTADSAIFDGNLQARVTPLRLPLNVGANTDLIEMVKRGKKLANAGGGDLFRNNVGAVVPVAAVDVDNEILKAERFANKTGIRVSLADSKAKLPGCASGAGMGAVAAQCGIRLEGGTSGLGLLPPVISPTPVPISLAARGYQPKPMRSTVSGAFNYTPTRVNGERLNTGGGREVWIKIETVQTNAVTGDIVTSDITEDILSMGVTEPATPLGTGATRFQITDATYNNTATDNSQLTSTTPQFAPTGTDSRSVIKLQRFYISGPPIPGSSNYLRSYSTANGNYSAVVRFTGVDNDIETTLGCVALLCTADNIDPTGGFENYAHLKRATVNGATDRAIVPFPIEMFDMREGYYYDSRTTTYYSNLSRIAHNGVMSMIDIDVANLRRFLRGDFNGLFPIDTPLAISKGNVGLVNTDIPERNGWVLYISDRRGDADFDGELDMEDIYGAAPGNDGILQRGEDLNPTGTFGNGVLNTSYGVETERYNTNAVTPDVVAINDHQYYRRGVRLINGTTLPGIYDAANAANTRGFTVASENGVYVQGNYNATGVSSVPATGNTLYNNYLPFNTPTHIPASIVADGVTVLSNAWNDGKSFSSPVTSPYDQSARIASTTQMRFAMISGDTIASIQGTPNQGGISPQLNGGVHNFKRFLERWTGQRLDYSGSLINLFNSRNNNGSFKCCNTVYNPPIRNWVFDSTFLDAARLPPGTPFFQYIQTTGFERTND